MKRLIYLLIALMATLPAMAKIRIVTSIPELAEFSRAIGGDLVEAESLATGVEDLHGVPMKPSFVPRLSRADVVVVMGMDAEHSFMPALIDASRNPKIQPDKPGYIDCSVHIAPLEVPKDLNRSEGEVHPQGNPHYNLDPVCGRKMVETICEGLSKNFPQYAEKFAAGRDAYLAKLDAKIAQWQEIACPLKGVQFVSYHNHWAYFEHRYDLKYLATIELKHGIEPTARHIAELIDQMKQKQCKLIVREPQFSDRVPNQVAAQTGAKVVTLHIMSGAGECKTYMDMIDYNIRTLSAAAREVGVAAQ